jgi:hypothetical protein
VTTVVNTTPCPTKEKTLVCLLNLICPRMSCASQHTWCLKQRQARVDVCGTVHVHARTRTQLTDTVRSERCGRCRPQDTVPDNQSAPCPATLIHRRRILELEGLSNTKILGPGGRSNGRILRNVERYNFLCTSNARFRRIFYVFVSPDDGP